LGNARTFLVNWALARQRGWHIVLRIDDLDGPRVKSYATQQTIDTLQWLGIDWDEGPHHQAQNAALYEAALRQLISAGEAYRCNCTRSQIAASIASAPHADEHELRYPGTCRPRVVRRGEFDPLAAGWRLRVPEGTYVVVDQFAGTFAEQTQQVVGDFRVAGKGGAASYQLAVVVDDAQQQIDCVVRGDDLLSSTPRQQLIRQRLGLGPEPQYWHLPLVVGDDGRRLAKRHGDTRLVGYRQAGVAAERVIGLLAEWCGLGPRHELGAAEFAERFDINALPRETVVMQPDDEQWLTHGTSPGA
jgi:glutamyl-tRNA synthetase